MSEESNSPRLRTWISGPEKCAEMVPAPEWLRTARNHSQPCGNDLPCQKHTKGCGYHAGFDASCQSCILARQIARCEAATVPEPVAPLRTWVSDLSEPVASSAEPCANHFSDGSKIFPNQECEPVASSAEPNGDCFECMARHVHCDGTKCACPLHRAQTINPGTCYCYPFTRHACSREPVASSVQEKCCESCRVGCPGAGGCRDSRCPCHVTPSASERGPHDWTHPAEDCDVDACDHITRRTCEGAEKVIKFLMETLRKRTALLCKADPEWARRATENVLRAVFADDEPTDEAARERKERS